LQSRHSQRLTDPAMQPWYDVDDALHPYPKLPLDGGGLTPQSGEEFRSCWSALALGISVLLLEFSSSGFAWVSLPPGAHIHIVPFPQAKVSFAPRSQQLWYQDEQHFSYTSLSRIAKYDEQPMHIRGPRSGRVHSETCTKGRRRFGAYQITKLLV